MADYLGNAAISQELERLMLVFPSARRPNLTALADEYKKGLVGISPHALHGAVDRCIQDDQYFPKVSRLRSLAFDYAKSHPSPFARTFPTDDPDICPVCGAHAKTRMIPRLKEGGDAKNRDDWEEVASHSTYMDHDPALHRHVFDREG